MNRNEAKSRLIEYGLTKEQAEQVITAAENDNCEPTSRLQPEHETTIEFSGSAYTPDKANGVTVYYYPERAAVEAAGGDLSNVDWHIDHYDTW